MGNETYSTVSFTDLIERGEALLVNCSSCGEKFQIEYTMEELKIISETPSNAWVNVHCPACGHPICIQ